MKKLLTQSAHKIAAITYPVGIIEQDICIE